MTPRVTTRPGAGLLTASALVTVVVLASALARPANVSAQSTADPAAPLLSLVASVVAAAGLGGGPVPTGSVTFTVDLKVVATIPLLGGVAQLSTATLGLGHHTVIAAYSGDSTHAPGVSVVSVPSSAGDIQLTIAVNPIATSAPVVSIMTPTNGAHYPQFASVGALYTCSDPAGTSVIGECVGPVPSGSPIDTSTAGPQSFSVTATNAAGQQSSASVAYLVDPVPGARVHAQGGSHHPPPVAAAQLPAPVVTPRPLATPPVVAPRAAAVAHARSVRRKRARRVRARAPLPRAVRPTAGGLRPYDPRSEPKKVIGVEVTAFTLLALIGGGLGAAGAAGGAGGGAGAQSGGGGASFDLDYEGVDVTYLAAAGGVALGDRSRTWRLPGTRAVDAASAALPARLAARSPVLARVAADGAYLRSILGSGALLPVVAGLVLGVAAVNDTGGQALPPGTAIAIAIAVLGVMDAAAGFVAVVAFAVGVAALGGLDSAPAVRTLLGLCALWFVVPVIAGAARPLRRDPPRDAQERFDRAADFVIVSLIGAWVVQKIVIALPGLAGYHLPIASHAGTAALCVLAALVVRMLGETAAAHFYPRRLVTVHHPDLREPGTVHRLLAAGLRTAIFVFVAVIIVGQTWQLWVAGALFLLTQVVAVYEADFPKSEWLGRVLPEGLLEIVFMIFLLTGLGALLLASDSKELLADSFVLLAIPGAVLAVLHAFGGGDEEHSMGWGRRVAGIFILTAGVLQVQGVLF